MSRFSRTEATSRISKPMGERRKVLVVDDHPLVRSGLVELLDEEHDLEGLEAASTAQEGLDAAKAAQPDVVVVDLSLQDGSGLELVEQLREALDDTPVLVYSMHDETLHAERALRAGASGYLMKNHPAGELVVAIRRILDGHIYLSKTMATRLLHQNLTAGSAGHEAAGESIDRLSEREHEVFGMIGDGMSTSQIAEKLGLSVKTIETYREHIKRKLDLDSGYALLRFATQHQMQKQGQAAGS